VGDKGTDEGESGPGKEGGADDMVSVSEVVACKNPALECVAYRDMSELAAAMQLASSVWANSPRAVEDVQRLPPMPGSATSSAPIRVQPAELEHGQAERAGVAVLRTRDAAYASLLPPASGADHETSWRYLRYSYDSAAPESAVVQLLGGTTEAKLTGARSMGPPELQAEDALQSRLGESVLVAVRDRPRALCEQLLRLLRLVRPLSFAVTPVDEEA
jgi:hypothetical protein